MSSFMEMLIGRNCELCKSRGVSCEQSGAILSDEPYRQLTVNIKGFGKFNVPGEIKDCSILNNQTNVDDGVEQLKILAQQRIDAEIDWAVQETLKQIRESIGPKLEIETDLWNQSK